MFLQVFDVFAWPKIEAYVGSHPELQNYSQNHAPDQNFEGFGRDFGRFSGCFWHVFAGFTTEATRNNRRPQEAPNVQTRFPLFTRTDILAPNMEQKQNKFEENRLLKGFRARPTNSWTTEPIHYYGWCNASIYIYICIYIGRK